MLEAALQEAYWTLQHKAATCRPHRQLAESCPQKSVSHARQSLASLAQPALLTQGCAAGAKTDM